VGERADVLLLVGQGEIDHVRLLLIDSSVNAVSP
jgi:hypothetical protein